MKTKPLNLKRLSKKFLQTMLLVAGISFFNTAVACTASFTYTIGANGHVSFTSTLSGFTYYPSCIWDPGDASGPMYGNTPNHIYTANGTYNVKLIASDSLCTDSITIPITITNVGTPCTLSASFTYSFGTHGNVTFTSTSSGTNANTLYYWNPGDGTGRVLGTSTFNHKYTNKGYYYIWLTIEDTGVNYCYDSTEMYITEYNADSNSPSCNLSVNFTYTVSANGNVDFTSTSTGIDGGSTLTWDPDDGSGTTVNPYYVTSYHHNYTKDGTYNVKLLIEQTDSSVCSDSLTIPVTINNIDTIEPCTLSADFTVTYNSNGQVTFTSTSTGTYANTLYYWNPGDSSGDHLGSSAFTYTYPFIGNYTATLILKDTGSGYCIDSISIPVNITNRDSLYACFIYTGDTLSDSLYSPSRYIFTSTSRGTNANTYYRWDPGDSTGADSGVGMTNYSHTYSKNGPYAATLTIWYTIPPVAPPAGKLSGSPHYDESSYTEIISVSTAPSGLATITSTGGNFTLYPNPNDGKFRIIMNNLGQGGKAQLSVTNVLGQEVLNTPVAISNHTLSRNIDLQHTPAGIYFVKVIASGKTYTTKLVIEKN